MIRFRNPGTNLDTLIAIFNKLYEELSNKYYFDNNDIKLVLTKANLMASSGFTGEKAVIRGSNKNLSLDRTFNNAKMYAEIFRLLGLISIINNDSSTKLGSSKYKFTFLGEHLASLNESYTELLEECILGINNPNEIMNVSYNESVRFFACVLLTMSQLDDMIYRDEMIIGPMCVNDNIESDFKTMINMLKNIRGNYNSLENELKDLAKRENIQTNTARNCTRFPISVLKSCNWVESVYSKIYGKKLKFMKLTEHGKEVVNRIQNLKDIRLSDYKTYTITQKEALIRLSMYQLLGRANFNLDSVEETMLEDSIICQDILQGKDTLFSPYQTLDYITVNKALGLSINFELSKEETINSFIPFISFNDTEEIYMDTNVAINKDLMNYNTQKYIQHIKDLGIQYNYNIDDITLKVANEHILDTKILFYPFIETLFRIIGFKCNKTRDGVNGERWDAMIIDEEKSIPIEIKSPTEEKNISIKAIRQALENKIVLLSRNTYPTKPEITSLAVGYYPPNDRAEVADLINYIKNTYNIKIAVFDIVSLIRLSVNIIINGKGIDINKFYDLEGIVDVSNFEN